VILWKTSHSASEGDITTTAPGSIDPARFLHDQLESAPPDLLRQMLATFINALMSAEADAVCGAPYGIPDPDRVNVRTGYRRRDSGNRAGTLDVAIPKLRSGSYFPDWLLERRRRAEAALTSVLAAAFGQTWDPGEDDGF
jgi:putative transposase